MNAWLNGPHHNGEDSTFHSYCNPGSPKRPLLIVNLSARPFVAGQQDFHRLRLTQAATQFGCYILDVNLAGAQDQLIFEGGSSLISPCGNLLFSAPLLEEYYGAITIDTETEDTPVPSLCRDCEKDEPFLTEQRYKALCLGLGDYVRNWNMWEWIDGVLPKMAELAKRYKRIFLVSNQQGVGKGRMTQADLDDIHRRMMADITEVGGRIDRIYTCTELESSNSPMRKPEIGMALQAQQEFPEVDFSRAVMVGDNVTDMLFARNAQLRAVYITKNNPVPDSVRDITDLTIECLPALGL